MILILEVTAPQAAQLGADSRKTFQTAGGIIGRDKSCDWVLPHTKVSGRHARITCVNSVFHVEDTSRNGVFLNSLKNRLVQGRPYPLQSGDRLLIEPYEIHITVSTGAAAAAPQPQRSYEPSPGLEFDDQGTFDGDDPFEAFSPPPRAPRPLPNLDAIAEALPGEELDPLKLLDPGTKPPAARQVPTARDLDRSSPMDAHYQPPKVAPPPPPPAQPAGFVIPEDYDPLAPDLPPPTVAPPIPTPVRTPAVPTPRPVPIDPAHENLADTRRPPMPPPAPLPQPEPAPSRPIETFDPPTLPPGAMRVLSEQRVGGDLASVLAGAGLEGVPVTPALAESFGQILRVVVAGVMDVLRARHQIKDEFRMRVTHFKAADNNPLKFSANVDDALHNLLVKRNEAYLDSVGAFEDAFDDLRNHQIALLAGMRVAFEAMLAEFDPDRLQESFDRQIKRGSLLGMPAKLRYWEQYRDRCQELTKDPEATFRKLFGEAFAKAYEEQLRLLKNRQDDGKH